MSSPSPDTTAPTSSPPPSSASSSPPPPTTLPFQPPTDAAQTSTSPSALSSSTTVQPTTEGASVPSSPPPPTESTSTNNTTTAASSSTVKPSTTTPSAQTMTPPSTTPPHKPTHASKTGPGGSGGGGASKKKRKPFASLLSFLGCFPKDDSSYDDKPKDRKPTPATSTAAPVISEKGNAPAAVGGAAATKDKSEPTSGGVAGPAEATASKSGAGEKAALATAGVGGAAVVLGGVVGGGEKTGRGPATPTKKRTADSEVVVAPSTPTTSPIDETAGLTSSSVVPPGSGTPVSLTAPPSPQVPASTASDSHDESFAATDSDADPAEGRRYDGEGGGSEEEEEEEEEEVSLLGGVGFPVGQDGIARPLLPPMGDEHKGRKCLVLDLDETLLHSSFKLIPQADFIVPVEIEGQTHNVYVIKRPGVDNFMKRMGELYEVVIFTASLSKYADPVLDMLDIHRVVKHRLFRESCYNHKGNYIKDLSQLGRPVDETIIIDNSPVCYSFHPSNAVPISTWFNDPHDSELSDLLGFLADLSTVEDVRGVLDGGL